MSYRYGSLRGLIGFLAVLISALLSLSPAAIALAGSATTGPAVSTSGTVEISATIAPVRIVVVDNKGRIVEIISNGPGNITPSVHKGSPDGPIVAMTARIAGQYAGLMRRADQHKTGVIYKRKDDSKHGQPFDPAAVPIMFTDLRAAL